jgi:tetratricopeptide (TPR) repeat protein
MARKETKKKIQEADKRLEHFEEALTKTELFIEKYQKHLTIGVLVVVLLVVGFVFFKKMIIAPRQKEALSQMFMAEKYFERDSFNLALNGDGNNPGFLDIIDEYKMTKAANLARYYSGISYLHLGQYDDAIASLKAFKSKDLMLSVIAVGAIGDAYMQLNDKETAAKYYLDAARKGETDFITPVYLLKAGEVLEDLNDLDQALKCYEEIRDKYPKSREGQNIEKYITRVELRKKLSASAR